jgi:hypothetical protein
LVGSVTGSGPWSWTCTNNANAVCNTPTICSTNLASQGQCNPASAKVWDAGSTSFTDNFCSTPGNPTPNYPFFPTADFPTSTWTCPGPNGGPTSNTCTATLNVNGVCGPAAQP